MLRIVEDVEKISAIQKELSEKMIALGKQKTITIGYQGGSERQQAYWFPEYGFWWSYGDEGHARHWNAFGIPDDESKLESKNQNITCQINFPKDPKTKTAGVLVSSGGGKIYVAHNGRVGGGKKGVGQAPFKERSELDWKHAEGHHGTMDVTLVSALDDKDLLANLNKFVREVRRFKSEPNELSFYRLVPAHDKPDITKNNSAAAYDPAASKYLEILEYKKQLIFYGPPGTGKTRMAYELAKAVTNTPDPSPSSGKEYKEYVLHMVETCAARCGLKMETSSDPNVQAVKGEKRFVVAMASSDGSVQTIDKVAADAIRGDVKPENCFRVVIDSANRRFKVVPYLEESGMGSRRYSEYGTMRVIDRKNHNKNDSLPTPNNGAQDFIRYLASMSTTDVPDAGMFDGAIKAVTFHPSYSYGEFVEGIAPKINADKLNYEIKKGVFAKICRQAADNPSRGYVMIIDEINRGNVPSIFGEIITLLEPDRRSDKDGSGYSVLLPYSGEKFGVPPNLYVIGTMNTSDRSLVQIDVALRRRFAFVELRPNSSLLKGEVTGIPLSQLLCGINRRLVKNGFEDKQIGHSYFMRAQRLEDLRTIMQYEIVPLIQDYAYDDYDKMAEILGNAFVDKTSKETKNEWIENDDVFIQGLNELAST